MSDHHALVFFGHVDHELLDRFHYGAVDRLGDDIRPGDLELVAFAAHHLDEDRQLQLAAPDHFDLLGRIGRLEADRNIAEQLAVEAVAQLPRRDILPVPACHGRGIDAENHRHGRLVDGNRRNRDPLLHVGDGFADRDLFDAGETDNVAGGGLVDVDALQPFEGIQLRHPGLVHRRIELAHRHRIADFDPPVEDAANRNASQVIAGIEIRHQQLQRRLGISPRRRHVLHDRLEQGAKVGAGVRGIAAGRSGPGVGVQDRELELFLAGVEIDEQIVDLVQHFKRARVRPVDLVHDDDRRQPPLECLAQDESRLRQRPFRGVDEQHHAVHH